MTNNCANIVSTISKFGVGCLSVQNTGYLTLSLNISSLPLNWTIEFWVIMKSISSQNILSTTDNTLMIQNVNNNSQFYMYIGGRAANVSYSTSGWNHFAICYSSSGYARIYLNGSLAVTSANYRDISSLYQLKTLLFGQGGASFYMDALHISSTSRYTGSSFSVPTSAPVRDQYTLLINNFDTAAGGSESPNYSDDLVLLGKSVSNYQIVTKPFQTSPHLYAYVTANSSSNNRLILSTSSLKNGDSINAMPSGFSVNNIAQLPYSFALDKQGGFVQCNWQGYKGYYDQNSPVLTIAGGSWQALRLGAYLPKTATYVSGRITLNTTSTTSVYVRLSQNSNGTPYKTLISGAISSEAVQVSFSLPSQTFYVYVSDPNSTAQFTIYYYSTFAMA